MSKISPLAPARFPDMPAIAGVRMGAGAAGIKRREGVDVMLAALDPGTAVAGVFTRSLTAAAPIDWCRANLPGGAARALVVNSGNANAFTGRAGIVAVENMAAAAADVVGCPTDQVFIAQTGVIGEPIAVEKISAVLPGIGANLGQDWERAARAIMTTDTFPKGAAARAKIDGTTVSIAGIAKGSGMIAPDMATMLAFVFTDAAIAAPALQKALSGGTGRSFNAITVDSDTSTSDTVLLFATAKAGNAPVNDPADPRLRGFRRALDKVLLDLAQQIVRDGEGASKFITVTVSGAAGNKAAKRIAMAIANSPLVKTAIAGEDANWGRVVMAVGKSGEKADRDKLSIAIGGVEVARDGERVSGYEEAPVAAHMKGSEIDIQVDVGIGRGKSTVWTCDLTYDYIRINADYRT
jgi:glutamate N-acetyltransferase/amino-acid N-acetyltransferase